MIEFQGRWLLLLHQIPPQPSYFRAKVLRRINQLGALAIKNSAYLLPARDETLEDLQWVRREIEEQGGEAWLFRTDTIAGLSDQAICDGFRSLRDADYQELARAGHRLLDELRARGVAETSDEHLSNLQASCENDWRRLKRRYEEVRRIDFFEASGSAEMETLMIAIDRLLHSPPRHPAAKTLLADLKGRTWVTRSGIMVDRIASAWLIRRFLDPAAQFMFVRPEEHAHKDTEIRFDMFDGEFTHEGDLCTFEVLLAKSGNNDPALQAVAEVVHDIDLKDGKYQRPEVLGIAPLIEGIALRHTDDMRRLEEGATLFEALYVRFRSEHSEKVAGAKRLEENVDSKSRVNAPLHAASTLYPLPRGEGLGVKGQVQRSGTHAKITKSLCIDKPKAEGDRKIPGKSKIKRKSSRPKR
jgi:hypothetical protein